MARGGTQSRDPTRKVRLFAERASSERLTSLLLIDKRSATDKAPEKRIEKVESINGTGQSGMTQSNINVPRNINQQGLISRSFPSHPCS